MPRALISILKFIALMVMSQQVFASGIPSVAFYFPLIPMIGYLVCGIIWASKSTQLTAIKRWLLVIFIFPLFYMAAYFIPLVIPVQDKYFDAVMILNSMALTATIIVSLCVSLTKQRK